VSYWLPTVVAVVATTWLRETPVPAV